MASPTRLDFGQFPVQTVQNSSQNNQSFNVCSSHIICYVAKASLHDKIGLRFFIFLVSICGQIQIYGPGKRFTCPRLAVSQTWSLLLFCQLGSQWRVKTQVPSGHLVVDIKLKYIAEVQLDNDFSSVTTNQPTLTYRCPGLKLKNWSALMGTLMDQCYRELIIRKRTGYSQLWIPQTDVRMSKPEFRVHPKLKFEIVGESWHLKFDQILYNKIII